MSGDTTKLTAAEKLDWLRLIRSENVGPMTFRRLLESYGSAAGALEALPELARRGGRKAIKVFSKGEAEREMGAIERAGGYLLALCEPAYPRPLAAIEDAPPVITVLGHPQLLKKKCFAIVGARNASINGGKLARTIAADLGRAGLVVVSGLARGLDAEAHLGALETGTIAVLGGGADVVYPRENARLYDSIRSAGAIISEMPMGVQPIGRHFPPRNRIISGLSLGVLVVEAAIRSGSLISAKRAGEQGREVFAVPGSPLDQRAHGPNSLIKDGAVLTETADDILRVLGDLLRRPMMEPPGPDFTRPPPTQVDRADLEKHRDRVLESLSTSPVPVDEIVRQCQLSPSVVTVILLELELGGRLERHPGNRVSLLG